MKKDARPMHKVMRPSTRNIHCHPAQPLMPRMCSRPKAMRDVMMEVEDRVVQK